MQFSIDQIAWMGLEVERQKAGASSVVGMARAVELIYNLDNFDDGEATLTFDILTEMNAHVTMGVAKDGFRDTPVVFQNGGSSASASEIPNALENLFSAIPTLDHEDVNMWIRHYLWVHPFEDGNGRTASIIRNWLLQTLDNPTPLPDYKW